MVTFFVISLHTSAQTGSTAAAVALRRAETALTDIITHDVFSPPVASRLYLYSNVAAYEILVKTMPGSFLTLAGQINDFPHLPEPPKNIDGGLAAINAFGIVARQLVFSESVMQDSLQAILRLFKTRKTDIEKWQASLAYGALVADSIMAWAKKDRYSETRKLPRYRLIKKEGKWIPTAPAYMAAIEPYWNRIRLITLDSSSQFRPPPAPVFSKDTNSLFFKTALEVYTVSAHLSVEQKDIANFWDCNPYAINMQGHLHFAEKKISPGGHWLMITGNVAADRKLSVLETSAACTLTSIALFDAFISCWDEKYRSNVIRPETYINMYIDEQWRPVLQTPPFPEYSSGHSVISAAAAEVLSRFLGDTVSFDDRTEVQFGLPVRHFTSFRQAAQEAGISRFYGGIHYQAAISTGLEEGRQIGRNVWSRIKLRAADR